MRKLGQRSAHGAGARWTRWAIAGWCLLTTAVAVTQAIAVSPTAAQNTLSPPTAASDTILAWGDNLYGQLGDGTRTDRGTPVPVSLPPGTTVTGIATGDNHSLALTSTGTVLGWGRNRFGQLGDETKTSRTAPVAVSLPSTHHPTIPTSPSPAPTCPPPSAAPACSSSPAPSSSS